MAFQEMLAGSEARRTVLVVDDDERVATLVADMVRIAGYNAVKAIGSDQAIKVFEMVGGEVDLVVSDYHMPGMNGEELVACLGARKPGLPVIFMTGHATSLSQAYNVIEKPFVMAKLERLMAQLLSTPTVVHAADRVGLR
jgi:DNA-binding NtrC family response regulator